MVTGLVGAAGVVGFGGMALAMVLSDLGNGVVRISGVCLVSVPLCVPAGWSLLSVPLTLRVRDSVMVALGLLGRSECGSRPGGVCRSMSDDATEYMVYAVDG
jgi:hypothetical protein